MKGFRSLFFVIITPLCKFHLAHCKSCPSNKLDLPCTSIADWIGFVEAIQFANELVFCPFSISKPVSSGTLVMTNPITAICHEVGKCIVNTAPNEVGGILKIRGQAEVTMVGFVFQTSGTMSSKSAIHITFATLSKQTFCQCHFNGFHSLLRGAAFRTERNTDVDLIGCTFTRNHSYDIGGAIFNRGSMLLSGCSFNLNSGRGSAFGSSINSKTILYDNSFSDNLSDIALFFHDFSFLDIGGNHFDGADNHCDGMFVDRGNICKSFLNDQDFSNVPTSVNYVSNSPTMLPRGSISPTITMTRTPAADVGSSSCARVETYEETVCISINSFSDFKETVENSDGTLIFCSFTLQKPVTQIIIITKNVDMICKRSGECRIEGISSHIKIVGPEALVYIQGFVFENATINAIRISSKASRPQALCDCKFIRNQGLQSRGVAILSERGTRVEIKHCIFTRNSSADLGGAIFNRGTMVISDSLFLENGGKGAAIGNAPKAVITLHNNTFENHSEGVPIFFHENLFGDLGGNVAKGNTFCNGIWIDRGGSRCIAFFDRIATASTTSAPSGTPTSTYTIIHPHVQEQSPRGGVGYYNYDINDNLFGPHNWGEVEESFEYKRLKELSGTLNRSLLNKCDWNNINQSPIDLCEDKINNDCREFHQTRTHSGNIILSDEHITPQVLPTKLRLKYYPDRPLTDGPYPPEADFANNWNGYAEVNHIDIKIPSEHTYCGTRYPAEYSIYMLHPERRQTIVLSIFLVIHEDDEDNDHLQKVIDEWQKVYDYNEKRCKESSKRNLSKEIFDEEDTRLHQDVNMMLRKKGERSLKDTSPFGKGGWDPFHSSLLTSIYHWGYWGSLTDPPCSTFVAWRVATKPAHISKEQLNQMERILFSNRNQNCQYTSVNHNASVARPIQPNRGRLLHKCTIGDYVSDEQKAEMRRKTGNPDWCC